MINAIRNIYLTNEFFYILAANIILFLLGFFYLAFYWLSIFILVLIIICVAIDIYLLFRNKSSIRVIRILPERFSNGDENPVSIYIHNAYPFKVVLGVVDEIPDIFQIRDFYKVTILEPNSDSQFVYYLKPKERGIYFFGAVNVFVKTPLRLAMRRWVFPVSKEVAVYPSFLQMKRYELMAVSNQLYQYGNHKLKKIGQSLEFEQIKNYVVGDDVRNINWKASARRNEVMLNHYRDERSQSVYCLIDKGRVMKMPFNQMTLLDYSINASLALLNIALKKGDKAGLISFSKDLDVFIKSDKSQFHLKKILESLYAQKSDFQESDYEKLVYTCRHDISQRSMLILFTNFESLTSLERQSSYFKLLSKKHLLLVVFFLNTELSVITDVEVKNAEQAYVKTIAQKFDFEKRLIVQKLNQSGVMTLLTKPENLSTDLIAKYLEIKGKGLM